MTIMLSNPIVVALFGDYDDEKSHETAMELHAHSMLRDLNIGDANDIWLRGKDIQSMPVKVQEAYKVNKFILDEEEQKYAAPFTFVYFCGRFEDGDFVVDDQDRVSVAPLIQLLPTKLVIIVIDNMDKSQCLDLCPEYSANQEFIILSSHCLYPSKCHHFKRIAFNLQCLNWVMASNDSTALHNVSTEWIETISTRSSECMLGNVNWNVNGDYTF